MAFRSTDRSLLRRAAPLAALLLLAAAPASAQSDILLQLRSGSPAGDRFRVDSAGGFVALGQLGIGIVPANGSGWRTMWYPFRGAFRSGGVNSGGNHWDDAQIGFYSWAGGVDTRASQYATFAFGDGAEATGVHAVAMGAGPTVSGAYGLGVGYQPRCTGSACLSLGYVTNAAGNYSIALGFRSTANADYSVAIGHRASTSGRTGAFVFNDNSSTDSTQATANNQFTGRFAGGWRLFTNATRTAGVTLSAGGSTWNAVSDRNRKENFAAVDGEDILLRLRSVPVTSWNYIAEGREVRHVGPMAQDWHAAFRLNDDPLTINMGDFDGVNLAAVQALERRTAEQAERIRELEAEQARQAREIEELRRAVAALAAP